MNRREFLQRVGPGSAVATAVALAGCGGSDADRPTTQADTPTPSTTEVVVADFGYEAVDGGTAVTVTVRNEGDTEEAALVEVEVTADDETVTHTDAVTLPPGGKETLRFRFDLDLEAADFVEVAPSVRPA